MIAKCLMRIFGIFLAVAATSCASQQAFAPEAASAATMAALPYQLVPGDKLHITVYDEPTLTGDYTIGVNGNLAFPLIGSMPAKGDTPGQLQDKLTAQLANGYLINPRVSVEVTSYRPIYVLGEVNKPGEYEYVPGMTVLAAVAKAEGFTYRAKEKMVFIKRRGSDQEVEVPLKSDTPVNPGDTIRIAERYF